MFTLPPALADLAVLSARIGSDMALVQGGGGNSSIKNGDTLWVKASGTWLANALDRSIFVSLSLSGVRTAIQDGAEDPTAGVILGTGSLRPSIETSLHALMPFPVVIHAHSVNVLSWATRQNGQALIADRLQGIDWAWLPYKRPGMPLTRALMEVMAQRETIPDVVILANHGVVVAGADCQSALDRLFKIEKYLSLPMRATVPADIQELKSRIKSSKGWRLPNHINIHALALDEVTRALVTMAPLYPDHVVYLEKAAPLLQPGQSMKMAVRQFKSAPFLVIPGEGVLVSETITPGAEAMLHCLALVGGRLPSSSGLVHLTSSEVAALLNWDAEKYRQELDI